MKDIEGKYIPKTQEQNRKTVFLKMLSRPQSNARYIPHQNCTRNRSIPKDKSPRTREHHCIINPARAVSDRVWWTKRSLVHRPLEEGANVWEIRDEMRHRDAASGSQHPDKVRRGNSSLCWFDDQLDRNMIRNCIISTTVIAIMTAVSGVIIVNSLSLPGLVWQPFFSLFCSNSLIIHSN